MMYRESPLRLSILLLLSVLLLSGCLSAENSNDSDSGETVDETDDATSSSRNFVFDELVSPESHDPSVIGSLFTVTEEEDGQPVAGLTLDDLEILENDEYLIPSNFPNFGPVTDIPGLAATQSIAVLLHVNSASQEDDIDRVRSEVADLIRGLAPYQQIALYVFDDEVVQLTDFSTNRRELVEALEEVERSGNLSTDLNAALVTAGEALNHEFTPDHVNHGAALVITSDRDRTGRNSLEEAREALVDIPLAAVTVGDSARDHILELTPEHLVHPREDHDNFRETVAAALQALALQTQATYGFYYASLKRAGTHELVIRLIDNDNSTETGQITAEFEADEFSSVKPEIVASMPPRIFTDRLASIPLTTRWTLQSSQYLVPSQPEEFEVLVDDELPGLKLEAEDATTEPVMVEVSDIGQSGSDTATELALDVELLDVAFGTDGDTAFCASDTSEHPITLSPDDGELLGDNLDGISRSEDDLLFEPSAYSPGLYEFSYFDRTFPVEILPTPGATFTHETGESTDTGVEVTFTADTTEAASWSWTVDGASHSGKEVTTTLTEGEPVDVMLTVEDAEGCTASHEETVTPESGTD